MRDKPDSKTYREGEPAAYSHVKYDGHFTRVVRGRSGVVRVYSSLGTDITDKMPDKLMLNVWRFVPHNTILLGELYAKGMKASYVKTALKEDHGRLRLSYFALETHVEYTAALEEVADLIGLWGLPFAPYRRLQDGWSVADEIAWGIENGGEGVVLKDGNIHNWRKLKPFKSIDLIIAGFLPGDGKYTGQVGSIICKTTEGHEVAAVSGMDDELRAALTPADIGRVIEVKYQYVGSRGRLRHPTFERFRDDKTAAQCSVAQDEELKALCGS